MTCLKMYSTLRLLIFKPSIFSFEKDFSGKDNKSDLNKIDNENIEKINDNNDFDNDNDNDFNREKLDIINQIAYGEENLVSIAA